jgi:hypothetical protein
MSIKQTLVTVLTITLILGLGVGGYFLIINYTQKKLSQLEEEALTTTTQEHFPPASVREIKLPDRPQVEKKSALILQLQPEQDNYSLNQTINLEVIVSVPHEGDQGVVVDGAEFVLQYDPQVIEVGEPVQGSFFSLYPQKKVDKQEGVIRVIAIQDPDENKPLTQEEILITFPLTLRTKGETIFTFDKAKTHIACCAGQELLERAEELTIKIK